MISMSEIPRLKITNEQYRMMKKKLDDVIYNIMVCDLDCKNVSGSVDAIAYITILKILRTANQQKKEGS